MTMELCKACNEKHDLKKGCMRKAEKKPSAKPHGEKPTHGKPAPKYNTNPKPSAKHIEEPYHDPKDVKLIKAKVDEGKSPGAKAKARADRNKRTLQSGSEKGFGGGKLRAADSIIERRIDVKRGSPGRKGEKVVGTPKTIDGAFDSSAESTFGVHMHSNAYGKNKNAPLQGAPVTADKEGKNYPTGGAAQARGLDGKPMAHKMVMEGQKNIRREWRSKGYSSAPLGKSELKPGMSYADLRKAEETLKKTEMEALGIAIQVRAALETVKNRLAKSQRLTAKDIPDSHPVKPLKNGDTAKDKATCHTCTLSWDDAVSTGWTPAPSARCPFEPFHKEPKEPKKKKK